MFRGVISSETDPQPSITCSRLPNRAAASEWGLMVILEGNSLVLYGTYLARDIRATRDSPESYLDAGTGAWLVHIDGRP